MTQARRLDTYHRPTSSLSWESVGAKTPQLCGHENIMQVNSFLICSAFHLKSPTRHHNMLAGKIMLQINESNMSDHRLFDPRELATLCQSSNFAEERVKTFAVLLYTLVQHITLVCNINSADAEIFERSYNMIQLLSVFLWFEFHRAMYIVRVIPNAGQENCGTFFRVDQHHWSCWVWRCRSADC